MTPGALASIPIARSISFAMMAMCAKVGYLE
jgi:hypothetical protein